MIEGYIIGLLGLDILAIALIGYMVGLSGLWIFADGIASLYAYTNNDEKSKTQTFLRDHSLRIFRCLVGLFLMYLGYALITLIGVGVGF